MSVYQWSQTAATNATADPSCPMPEGMAPNAVNDGVRGAMAAVAKYRDDIAGAIVTTGTGNNYAVTSFSSFDTLAHLHGQMISFVPNVVNAAPAVALNVDGLGAKALRSAPGVELPAGTLLPGTPYTATYNNSDGAFYLHGFYGNPYSVPIGGMIPYLANTVPNSNFCLGNGQQLSRTTYSTLFSLIGTTYGVGDGSSTFNVIDTQGCVLAGVDNGIGRITGLGLNGLIGSQNHILTTGELPASPLSVTGTTSGYNPTAQIIPSGSTPHSVTATGAEQFFPAAFFNTLPGFSSLAVTATTANMGSGNAMSLLQPTRGINYMLRII